MPARALITALAAALALAGCQYPRDPDGTLERVEGGTMRVGIVAHEPWTRVEEGRLSGAEVELVRRFARDLDARVDWSEGSEEELMGALKEGDLDLVIGGLTSKTPYKKEAAITRPYVKTELVIGVPRGSSAPEDFEGTEIAVEAGTDAGGLVQRKTDGTPRPVQELAEAEPPVATEDFFLDDLGLTAAKTLQKEKHVMATRLGENAFLVRLERYLLDREAEIERLLREEQP